MNQYTFLLIELGMIFTFVLFISFVALVIFKRIGKKKSVKKHFWLKPLFRVGAGPLSGFIWLLGFAFMVDFAAKAKIPYAGAVSIVAKVIYVGALAILGYLLFRWKEAALHEYNVEHPHSPKEERYKVELVQKLATLGFILLIILAALQIFGVDWQTVLAVTGAGGIVIGFASKDVGANFFTGLMLYIVRPFTIGDEIKSPDKQIEGVVEEIGWMMTMIRSPEKRAICVPNSVFSQIVVVNLSQISHRHFLETLIIRPDRQEKLEAFANAVRNYFKEHAEVDHYEAPQVSYFTLTQGAVQLRINIYLLPQSKHDYLELKQEFILKVLELLHRHELQIADNRLTVALSE